MYGVRAFLYLIRLTSLQGDDLPCFVSALNTQWDASLQDTCAYLTLIRVVEGITKKYDWRQIVCVYENAFSTTLDKKVSKQS